MSSYSFVLAIIFIAVGIPVISGAIVSIVHGPKESRKDRKQKSNKDSEMLEEIYYGLGDLGKRVKNLETILDEQGGRDE